MSATGSLRALLPASLLLVTTGFATGCGVFAMQRDQDALTAKQADQTKKETTDLAALRADLDATRERLDNALRANADTGSDLMSEKARLNQFAGRIDEVAHAIDELNKTIAALRAEIDAKIDDLKRTQAVQPVPAPPPIVIPADKGAHFAALQGAYDQKDWGLVRTLGHEYLTRYATDEKADAATYLIGDGDLQDGRPSSALGEFNRILKEHPRSTYLSKTLFGMGAAYEAMHDCTNAKLAYQACETHFARERIGVEAKRRIQAIDKLPAGSCAPP